MNPLRMSTRSLSTSTPSKTLLITFDAFDTLFYPEPPVPEQYATVAHEYGLPRDTVTPKKIAEAFKVVYKAHSVRWPNYGRADVLRGKYGGPKQWWEEVMHESFTRVLASDGKTQSFEFPPGMANTLLNRFSGDEGYALFDDVHPFFSRMRGLRESSTRRFDRILLGIISNSDDRVPSVLKALGLRVGDLRADQDRSSMQLPGFEHRDESQFDNSESSPKAYNDLDFVITSYEAGEGKPNKMIFDVAKRQARLLPSSQGQTQTSVTANETGDWVCVHVGDEYKKDYCAATDAGWESYLIARGGGNESPAGPKTISSLLDLIDKLDLDS